jgi:hypothetical protein
VESRWKNWIATPGIFVFIVSISVMPHDLIDPILELISFGIHYEIGSTQFNIVLAASFVAWLVVARVMMAVFQSDRGILSAALALAFPLFFGLLAYGLADWQLVPLFEADWYQPYLPLSMLFLVSFLVVLITSKRFFMLSGLSAIVIFVFASATAMGTLYAAGVVLETLEKGSDQIKQREERNKQEIESVM